MLLLISQCKFDMLVKISKPKFIGENQFGSTFELETPETPKYLIGYRNKGSVLGNHYHKGIEKRKNPEVFFLMSGNVELSVKHIETGETEKHECQAPCKIEFLINVIHTLYALTDLVFIEFNSLEEHKNDTFYLETK